MMKTRPVEHQLFAADGWRLHVLEVAPATPAWAVVVAGHAMMVDRRTLFREDRPSLAGAWAERGMRVLVPDLRGHGSSGPRAKGGGSWTYDQMVDDVALYCQLARRLEPGLPLVLAGNSLFGHLSLAYLGMHPEERVAALVGFAVTIWNRRWDASPARGALKQAAIAASRPFVRALGYFPAERFGIGSEDEPRAYWDSTLRWVPGNCWDSRDGVDYAARLSRVNVPFLHVLSDGDRLLCQPDDALLFSAELPQRHVLRIGPRGPVAELAHAPPGHVEMVSHPRCLPLWNRVEDWIEQSVR